MEPSSNPNSGAACPIATKMIFVAGSTSDTGRPTVRLLLQKGHRMGALARKEDQRSRELAMLGEKIILGDMLKIADLRRALKDVPVWRAVRLHMTRRSI